MGLLRMAGIPVGLKGVFFLLCNGQVRGWNHPCNLWPFDISKQRVELVFEDFNILSDGMQNLMRMASILKQQFLPEMGRPG